MGDRVTNGDSAVTTDNAGSAYGVQFGADKIKSFGQWQIKALSRRLEQNAWVNKLGDSDAYGGAVNSEGTEVVLKIGLAKRCTLGVDYYSMNRINGANATSKTSLIQTDVVYKF